MPALGKVTLFSMKLDASPMRPARAAGINALHIDPHGLCEDKHHQDIASLTDILTSIR